MKFIDGKKIAAQKLVKVKEIIQQIDVEPALAVILIGDDPASHLYVKLKEKAARNIGIELHKYIFNKDVSVGEIKKAIEFLNNDNDTNGIIVQLPLPSQLDVDEVVGFLDPKKDVDGFHSVNQERFLNNKDCLYPVFPNAIMNLVDSEIKDLKNKKVTIIGKSDIFDKVMTHAFEVEGADVQFLSCMDKKNISTKQQTVINESDVVVTACGKKDFITCDYIGDGTIVIDGGISKDGDKTIGDIDVSDCDDRKIIISPVPGGVGPVTIACLLENTVELTKKQS